MTGWPAPFPPVNRRAVREARDPLLTLSRRLVECEQPCPRAVALASFLICDPDSPAYWDRSGASLVELVSAAVDSIDHRPLR